MRRNKKSAIKSGRRNKRKKRKKRLGLKISIATVLILAMTYVGVAFLDIPVISEVRNIYIETAMTTGDHQWLATLIFPNKLIKEVMDKRVINVDVVGGVNTGQQGISHNTQEINSYQKDYEDILGQKQLKEGDLDYAGNKILVNDIDQGIVISQVEGATFKGKIAIIDDPSRVFVGFSKYDSRGLTIKEMLKEHDAILGVNANGFSDYEGVGMGDEILGLAMSKGEKKGQFNDYYCTIAFDENNNLIVGNVGSWENYNIRDGGQFNPVLIANGQRYVENSSGWGLQPRTAIGQRKDGAVMFLVIDGRKPTHSIGATVGDCADILESYGAINAACCDGGSSSVMGYNNEVITECSSPMEGGRYLPNAFLVKAR